MLSGKLFRNIANKNVRRNTLRFRRTSNQRKGTAREYSSGSFSPIPYYIYKSEHALCSGHILYGQFARKHSVSFLILETVSLRNSSDKKFVVGKCLYNQMVGFFFQPFKKYINIFINKFYFPSNRHFITFSGYRTAECFLQFPRFRFHGNQLLLRVCYSIGRGITFLFHIERTQECSGTVRKCDNRTYEFVIVFIAVSCHICIVYAVKIKATNRATKCVKIQYILNT